MRRDFEGSTPTTSTKISTKTTTKTKNPNAGGSSNQQSSNPQQERERTMKKRGIYFTLFEDEPEDMIYWSSMTGSKCRVVDGWDAKNDEDDRKDYMAHRRERLMPQDFTHIEAMDEEESEMIMKNTDDANEKDEDEEDENEEFVVAYDGPCDRVWLKNVSEPDEENEGVNLLRIVEARYGTTIAEAIDVREKVQDLVDEDGLLTFGEDKSRRQNV